MEDLLREEEVINLTNLVLVRWSLLLAEKRQLTALLCIPRANHAQAGAGIAASVQNLDEVKACFSRTSLAVAAAEAILKHQIPGVERHPLATQSVAQNTALVVGSLSSLLCLELSHISGTRIAHEGSLPDIVDLVEILATLMKGPMPRRAGDSTAPAAPAADHAGLRSLPTGIQAPGQHAMKICYANNAAV